MPLLLAIPDLPAAADQAPGMVDLPALSELMRHGTAASADRDWHSGLLRDLGALVLAAAAPAEIAAHALALTPGSRVCLATPVHVVAGMSRVHLHAAGVLSLGIGQRQRFQAEFAAQFGAEPLLHEAGEGWVLEAPWADAANDGDPADWRGAPLSREPASTAQQRALRRTGAEIEMWLAGSQWNKQRELRGELPANLLWLWGGGRVAGQPEVPALRALRLHAAQVDPWLAGIAALSGQAVQHLPPQWSGADWREEAQGNASKAFVLATSGMDARQWQELERCWFEPVLRDLRARRLDSLTLRLGRRSWQIRLRFWRGLLRRSLPWWQAARA
jgi:hypothetical protein